MQTLPYFRLHQLPLNTSSLTTSDKATIDGAKETDNNHESKHINTTLIDDQKIDQAESRPSRALRLTLKKTKIHSLFEKYISDPRREASVTYSLPSLLMHGLLNLMLRLKSRHAFTDAAKLSPHFGQNVASLIGATQMPSVKTVEDVYMWLDPNEVEPILPKLFSSLLKSKFFTLHPEFKTMGFSF